MPPIMRVSVESIEPETAELKLLTYPVFMSICQYPDYLHCCPGWAEVRVAKSDMDCGNEHQGWPNPRSRGARKLNGGNKNYP